MKLMNTMLLLGVAICATTCAANDDDGRFALWGRPAIAGQSHVETHKIKKAVFSAATQKSYPESIGGSLQYEYISSFSIVPQDEDYFKVTVKVVCPLLYNSPGFPGYGTTEEYVNVWIDWNGDYGWSDAERVMARSTANYEEILANNKILYFTTTVKSNASVSKVVKARAMLGYGYNPLNPATYSWTWGDVEDVNVELGFDPPEIYSVRIGQHAHADMPFPTKNSVKGVMSATNQSKTNSGITDDNSVIAGYVCPIYVEVRIRRQDRESNNFHYEAYITGDDWDNRNKKLKFEIGKEAVRYETVNGVEYGYYRPTQDLTHVVEQYLDNSQYGKRTAEVVLNYSDNNMLLSQFRKEIVYYLFYRHDSVCTIRKGSESRTEPYWFHLWRQFVPDMNMFSYDPKLSFRGLTTTGIRIRDVTEDDEIGTLNYTFSFSLGPAAYDCQDSFPISDDYTQSAVSEHIDSVYRTVKHEFKHQAAYVANTKGFRKTNEKYSSDNSKYTYISVDDVDEARYVDGRWLAGDFLCKAAEKTYGTHNDDTDTYKLGNKDGWSEYRKNGDQEYWVRRQVDGERASDAVRSQDWSDQGAQIPPSFKNAFVFNAKVMKATPYASECSLLTWDEYDSIRANADLAAPCLIDVAMSRKAEDVTTEFSKEGLRLRITVNAGVEAKYRLTGYLTGTQGEPLVKSSVTVNCPAGKHDVDFIFDGKSLLEASGDYSGPYVLAAVTCAPVDTDVGGILVWTGAFIQTKDYSLEECNADQIVLLDEPSDAIRAGVGLEITIPMYFPHEADYVSSISIAQSKSAQVFSNPVVTNHMYKGKGVASIVVPARDIYAAKCDGSCIVKTLSVMDLQTGERRLFLIDFPTKALDYRGFISPSAQMLIEPGSVELSLLSDPGQSGLYCGINASLQMTCDSSCLNVPYRFVGQLAAEDGRVVSEVSETLKPVSATDSYVLHFPCSDLRKTGVDGVFMLRRFEVRTIESDEVVESYYAAQACTPSVSMNEFVPELGVDEEHIDVTKTYDAYGRIEHVILKIPVAAPSSGSLIVSGMMKTKDGDLIMRAESNQHCVAGTNIVDLVFEGTNVFSFARNGPYEFVDMTVVHSGSPDVPCAFNVNVTLPADYRKYSRGAQDGDAAENLWLNDGSFSNVFATAATYDGYVLDAAGAFVGTIQVKTTKGAANKKAGVLTSTVTATLTLNGKKWSYSKGTTGADGLVSGLACTTKGAPADALVIELGENGFTGELGSYTIFGARNGMVVKNDPMVSALDDYKNNWSMTLAYGVESYSRWRLSVGAKGVIKVSGLLADGTAVTANSQLIMGDGFAYVPVVVAKTAKRDAINLLVRIDSDGVVSVASSDYGAPVDAGATEPIELEGLADSVNAMVGVCYEGRVVINELGYPAKFSASGLPTGLKINASTGVISGVPTKAGTYDKVKVTIVSGSNSKDKKIATYAIDISPMPQWAQGTFTGSLGEGTFTMTVSAAGKISGKAATLGTNFTFSATGYAASSESDLGLLTVTADLKSGKAVFPMTLTSKTWMSEIGTRFVDNASFTGETFLGEISAWRTLWSDKENAKNLSGWAGAYTYVTADGEVLAINLDEKGVAKITGTLKDKRKVSTSSTLFVTEEDKRDIILYVVPDNKKGFSALFKEISLKNWYHAFSVGGKIAYRNAAVTAAVSDLENGGGTVAVSPKYGQAEVGKQITLTAKPDKNSVFVKWVYTDPELGSMESFGSTLKMPSVDSDLVVSAVFRSKSEPVAQPIISYNSLEFSGLRVGVCFESQLMVPDDARPVKFTAKNLPAGLKLEAETGRIYGVPTEIMSGTIVVTATSTSEKKTDSRDISVSVAELPDNFIGTFYGYFDDNSAKTGNPWWGLTRGTFTLTATAQGKLTLKVVSGYGTASYTTTGWSGYSNPSYGGIASVDFVGKNGEEIILDVRGDLQWSDCALEGEAVGGIFGIEPLQFVGQMDAFRTTGSGKNKVYEHPELSYFKSDLVGTWKFMAEERSDAGIPDYEGKIYPYTHDFTLDQTATKPAISLTIKEDGMVTFVGTFQGEKISGTQKSLVWWWNGYDDCCHVIFHQKLKNGKECHLDFDLRTGHGVGEANLTGSGWIKQF